MTKDNLILSFLAVIMALSSWTLSKVVAMGEQIAVMNTETKSIPTLKAKQDVLVLGMEKVKYYMKMSGTWQE